MTQDTRPPVGSTGTLAELQVGPGDTYEHVMDGSHWRASYYAGRLANQEVPNGGWGLYVDESTQKYRLISRAKPAPVETRVPCQRGLAAFRSDMEFGTCIERNGKIIWDTWEPSE